MRWGFGAAFFGAGAQFRGGVFSRSQKDIEIIRSPFCGSKPDFERRTQIQVSKIDAEFDVCQRFGQGG